MNDTIDKIPYKWTEKRITANNKVNAERAIKKAERQEQKRLLQIKFKALKEDLLNEKRRLKLETVPRVRKDRKQYIQLMNDDVDNFPNEKLLLKNELKQNEKTKEEISVFFDNVEITQNENIKEEITVFDDNVELTQKEIIIEEITVFDDNVELTQKENIKEEISVFDDNVELTQKENIKEGISVFDDNVELTQKENIKEGISVFDDNVELLLKEIIVEEIIVFDDNVELLEKEKTKMFKNGKPKLKMVTKKTKTFEQLLNELPLKVFVARKKKQMILF